MKFFHLSHTDLDGYGCQFISRKIFPDAVFQNANYGLEVKLFLKDILEQIEKTDKNEDILFMITDLNLTPDESKNLNHKIKKFNEDGYKIKLQLLDHHGTGQKSADKYDWYYLDISRSATKITYDYFCENYPQFLGLCEDNFESLIDAINAVDIWLENEELFEFGKVCMSMISKAYEINNILFRDLNRDYRFYLLQETIKYVSQKDGHILLDENIYHIKKNYLKLSDENNTMDNLSSLYLVKSLENKKDELTVHYKEFKGLLTFTLGGISIPANTFLKVNKDYDFFIDVSRRGKASLRADNKIDVAVLAAKLAGGGGHPNASGLAFKDWKDTILYSVVKNYIQKKLNECD
ncbi:MAG: phosphoesterase [Campylobacterota bacterium]|nr:phosphoesterase [Campylobacterota bacterium]